MRSRTAGLAVALALSAATCVSAQTKDSAEDLTIFPSTLSLARDGARTIMVATRSGKRPPRVEWTVSNPAVASVASTGASADVRARAAGRVVVTARVNGRTSSASVTVLDAPALPWGTTRWSLAPIPGLTPRPLLDASRIDDEGPDLFAVDADPKKRFSILRALGADGSLVWQSTVRGTPWAGDRYGGLLVRLGAADQPSRALARLDRPRSKVPAWRYKSRGDIDDFAEADDGTIFLIEQRHSGGATGARDEDSQVAVVDGKTGLERSRFPLPSSTRESAGTCVPKASVVRRESQVGTLGEGANDVVYAELLVSHDSWTRACEKGRPLPGRGHFKVSRELRLVRLTRKGIEPVRTLWRSDADGPDTPERMRSIEDAAPGPVVELKSGELIALWSHLNVGAGGVLAGQLHVARVSRGDVVRDVVRVANFRSAARSWRVLVDAVETPWIYLADGSMLQAIDMVAGATVWSRESTAVPFEALDDRGIVVDDVSQNQLFELNQRGATLRTFPARVDDARLVIQGNGIVHGVDPQTRAVIGVEEPGYRESGWFSVLDVDASYKDARRRFADFLLETR